MNETLDQEALVVMEILAKELWERSKNDDVLPEALIRYHNYRSKNFET